MPTSSTTSREPVEVPNTEKQGFKRIFTYPLLRKSEMSDELRYEAMELVVKSCETFPDNNQAAAQLIKETLDTEQGGSWHVVVGEQFGLEISYEKGSLLYMFFGGNLAVCLWKCNS